MVLLYEKMEKLVEAAHLIHVSRKAKQNQPEADAAAGPDKAFAQENAVALCS